MKTWVILKYLNRENELDHVGALPQTGPLRGRGGGLALGRVGLLVGGNVVLVPQKPRQLVPGQPDGLQDVDQPRTEEARVLAEEDHVVLEDGGQVESAVEMVLGC